MNIDFTRTIIKKVHWIVESEMAKDAKQQVLDFSKLVMGDSENKLFVGSSTNTDEKFLDIFKKIVLNCKGNVWVTLIPQAGEWGSNEKKTFVKIT